tara:strand:+ start:239 stop:616 length:378 start_codon:yes stop_codon:yes gene_type:complete
MVYTDRKHLVINDAITNWVKQGLISNDYREVYDRWAGSFECEKCRHDYSYYKKCMDHCHITGAFRNILCDACNVNDKINNTSGYPNISKDGNGWIYKKTIRKVTGSKWFKTKEETIKYKLEIEST